MTPLVLYHQVVINYGGFASGADAELFGAAALGLDRKDYYRLLCTAADEVTAPTAACGTRRT